MHYLFRHVGLLGGHDLLFGFDACRVILLYIPNVCVTPSLYIILRLVHGKTEAVVDLLMDTVFGLIPDQARNGIDGGFKELGRLPSIRPFLEALLPATEAESRLCLRKGSTPDVCQPIRKREELWHELGRSKNDEIATTGTPFEGAGELRYILRVREGYDHQISPSDIQLLEIASGYLMLKRTYRGCLLQESESSIRAYEPDVDRAVIHMPLPEES